MALSTAPHANYSADGTLGGFHQSTPGNRKTRGRSPSLRSRSPPRSYTRPRSRSHSRRPTPSPPHRRRSRSPYKKLPSRRSPSRSTSPRKGSVSPRRRDSRSSSRSPRQSSPQPPPTKKHTLPTSSLPYAGVPRGPRNWVPEQELSPYDSSLRRSETPIPSFTSTHRIREDAQERPSQYGEVKMEHRPQPTMDEGTTSQTVLNDPSAGATTATSLGGDSQPLTSPQALEQKPPPLILAQSPSYSSTQVKRESPQPVPASAVPKSIPTGPRNFKQEHYERPIQPPPESGHAASNSNPLPFKTNLSGEKSATGSPVPPHTFLKDFHPKATTSGARSPSILPQELGPASATHSPRPPFAMSERTMSGGHHTSQHVRPPARPADDIPFASPYHVVSSDPVLQSIWPNQKLRSIISEDLTNKVRVAIRLYT